MDGNAGNSCRAERGSGCGDGTDLSSRAAIGQDRSTAAQMRTATVTRGDFTLYPLETIPVDGSRFYLVAKDGTITPARHLGKRGIVSVDHMTGEPHIGTLGYHYWCRRDSLRHLVGKLVEALYG